MSRKVRYTTQFKKDYRRAMKRGMDIRKLDVVAEMIESGEQLPTGLNDHQLVGDWKGCRELHIEPDWLLIYRSSDTLLEFVRTGSHSDLFMH